MTSLEGLLLQAADGKTIQGMSLVPVYVYGAGGSDKSLVGHSCIFLGRECAGDYKGLYNPFGGKTESCKTPVQTLLEETQEEMCCDISEAEIMDCLLSIHPIAFGSGVSLVVFVHIVGLQTRLWTDIMTGRTGRTHKWREMDKVKHVSVRSVKGDVGLSTYAKSVIQVLIEEEVLSKLDHVRPLHAKSIRTKH